MKVEEGQGILPATYQVIYDEVAFPHAEAIAMRATWKDWARYGFKLGGAYTVLGVAIWAIASFYASKQYSWQGLFFVCLFCLAVGLFVPLFYFIRAIDKREADPYKGYCWSCQMTEKGWGYETESGHGTFIPWQSISLVHEVPEAWLIKVLDEPIWVYRQPLQRAGLEDEFRRRIEASKTERTGS